MKSVNENCNPSVVVWLCQVCGDRVPNYGTRSCTCGRVEIHAGAFRFSQTVN